MERISNYDTYCFRLRDTQFQALKHTVSGSETHSLRLWNTQSQGLKHTVSGSETHSLKAWNSHYYALVWERQKPMQGILSYKWAHLLASVFTLPPITYEQKEVLCGRVNTLTSKRVVTSLPTVPNHSPLHSERGWGWGYRGAVWDCYWEIMLLFYS